MGMLTVGSLSHARRRRRTPPRSRRRRRPRRGGRSRRGRNCARRDGIRGRHRDRRGDGRTRRGRDRRSRRLRNRARRRRRRGARTKTRAREARAVGTRDSSRLIAQRPGGHNRGAEEFPFRRMTRTREPSGRPRRRRRAPSSVIGRRARPRRHARRPLASRACGSVRPRGASATIRRKFKDVCVPPRHRDESSCHSLEPGRPNQESTSKRSPR